jgi:hypothetical protein
MMKSIKNGKLCVLYSPGFGAGWYTWHGIEELLFDSEVVNMVLNNDTKDTIINYCRETYGDDIYLEGADTLTVGYVDTSEKFRIAEYDGSESIVLLSEDKWFEA